MYGTLIASVTVGAGGAASIDFTSIAQTPYTDLVVVLSTRSAWVNPYELMYLSFNGSSTTSTTKILYSSGSTVATSSENWSTLKVGYVSGASATSNTFGNTVITIPNYNGSTNKIFSANSTGENNATAAYQSITAGTWPSTAAITSISLTNTSASNWLQYSTAYLYGVTKGSGGATAA